MRGRPVRIGGCDVARHHDGIPNGFAIELVHGESLGRVADAGGRNGAVGEIRQNAHRNLTAADLGNARRQGFADGIDQVGAHRIPGIDEQVHRQSCIPTRQRQATQLDVTNATASLSEPRVHGVCGTEKFVRRRPDTLFGQTGIGQVCQVDLSREE